MKCSLDAILEQLKAINSKNEASAMHNSSGIALSKALETTLSKAKLSERHNNNGIAPL